MKNKLVKLVLKLVLKYVIKKHPFPAACLIHRKNNKANIFEIEFNWFDEELNPVSIVRDVNTHKIFSIRIEELKEFKEYSGARVVGNTFDV